MMGGRKPCFFYFLNDLFVGDLGVIVFNDESIHHQIDVGRADAVQFFSHAFNGCSTGSAMHSADIVSFFEHKTILIHEGLLVRPTHLLIYPQGVFFKIFGYDFWMHADEVAI